MNTKLLRALVVSVALCLGWSAAWPAESGAPYPANATFTTVAITPLAIEGLTMDATGNFYTTGRQTAANKKCPVWRIGQNGSRKSVGFIPNSPACNPSGIAFDAVGSLYIADGGMAASIWKVVPDPVGCASDESDHPLCAAIAASNASSPTAAFATGVPGTNGLAFDKNGNLWTGDGVTGFGRVWKITAAGANCTPPAPVTSCEEVFRIQPMNNSVSFQGTVPDPGVGRVNATIQPGAANNPQNLVANGLAFNTDSDLFVADTARGALWQVKFKADGSLQSEVGCDETFHSKTLCLDNVFVADPRLEGVDGIAFDQNGNIWGSVNERNAIAIFGTGAAAEVFRNPVNPNTRLRNDSATDDSRILEFPTSPFLLGKVFCTANSDGNRRDNAPNNGGEINAGGPVGSRGKISCMDQELTSPGLPLPVE